MRGRVACAFWHRDKNLRVNRPQFRMIAHNNLIATQGYHCRSRLGLKGNYGADVVKAGSEILDDLLGSLSRSAGAVEDKVQFPFLDSVTNLHQPVNVRPFNGIRGSELTFVQPLAGVGDDCALAHPLESLDVFEANPVEVRPLRSTGTRAFVYFLEDLTPGRH